MKQCVITDDFLNNKIQEERFNKIKNINIIYSIIQEEELDKNNFNSKLPWRYYYSKKVKSHFYLQEELIGR
jgi:hypothetical protein